MIHEVQSKRLCDSLILSLEREVQLGLRIELAADSLLTAKDRQISILQKEVAVYDKRLENQFQFTKELKKEGRKYKILGLASVGLLVVAILN